MRPELRREIERWFLRRGVPQLVAGYTSERQMDNRAAPLIIGWADRRLGRISLTPAREQPMNPAPHGPGMHC